MNRHPHAGTQRLVIQALTTPVPGFDPAREAAERAQADGRAAGQSVGGFNGCPYGRVRYLNPMNEPDPCIRNWQVGFLMGRSELL